VCGCGETDVREADIPGGVHKDVLLDKPYEDQYQTRDEVYGVTNRLQVPMCHPQRVEVFQPLSYLYQLGPVNSVE